MNNNGVCSAQAREQVNEWLIDGLRANVMEFAIWIKI